MQRKRKRKEKDLFQYNIWAGGKKKRRRCDPHTLCRLPIAYIPVPWSTYVLRYKLASITFLIKKFHFQLQSGSPLLAVYNSNLLDQIFFSSIISIYLHQFWWFIIAVRWRAKQSPTTSGAGIIYPTVDKFLIGRECWGNGPMIYEWAESICWRIHVQIGKIEWGSEAEHWPFYSGVVVLCCGCFLYFVELVLLITHSCNGASCGREVQIGAQNWQRFVWRNLSWWVPPKLSKINLCLWSMYGWISLSLWVPPKLSETIKLIQFSMGSMTLTFPVLQNLREINQFMQCFESWITLPLWAPPQLRATIYSFQNIQIAE